MCAGMRESLALYAGWSPYLTYSKPCDALQHGLKPKGLLRNRAYSSCPCPPEYFLMKV